MSSRYLTLMSVERLLAAERYRQMHQPTPPTHATRHRQPHEPSPTRPPERTAAPSRRPLSG
jgi:hypothetical protein